jgi:cysteine-rich repeat protein
MPVIFGGNSISNESGERGAPPILKSAQAVERTIKLTVLCAIAAPLLPVAKPDAQCVGGAPNGIADVTEDCDDGNAATGDGCNTGGTSCE